MSLIEKEIQHEIGKGKEYADWAREGLKEGLRSFGRLAGGFIPYVSYYQDQGGRLVRVITPAPLQVLLFKSVPRYEIVTGRRV